jgi:GDP-D-mannose 3',5'-epimerase
MIINIANKKISIKNTLFQGVGVRGRNSDNTLIEKELKWKPNYPLDKGIRKTYNWIKKEIYNRSVENK